MSVESQESLKESLKLVQRDSRGGPGRVRRGSVESQESLKESLKGVQRESG